VFGFVRILLERLGASYRLCPYEAKIPAVTPGSWP
jgi:hypothetical protein